MSVPLPSLRTPRLILRSLGPETMAALLDVERLIERDRDIRRADDVLLGRLAHWAKVTDPMQPCGTWAVFRDETAIGRVAVDRRDDCPHAWLSYALAPAARRQGLATEAARVVLHWAFDADRVSEIRSLVRPTNRPSIAVARRLGMVKHPDSDGQNSVFAIRRAA